MTLQRAIIFTAGAFIALGFAESQAGPLPPCGLTIEIKALRGGSPTVTVGSPKKITAKARIAKGTAPAGTTIDTTLQIEAIDGETIVNSRTSSPHRLVIGKGGTGNTFPMDVSPCPPGSTIRFVATFFGNDGNGALCDATQEITKTCK
jgi:hypothetical protein